MARVEVVGLRKVFGEKTALRELSLAVEDGEFVVLVGPSGCGKSTALRIIAGLEEATSGEVRIGERRVDHLEPRERDVALVFQNYALYPHKTVAGNLAFPLRMARLPRREIDHRVKCTADLLGLGDLLRRKPATLSGGQMQRVALGRAMIREPEVFLFDEPLSNLDAQMRVEMRAEIARLHRRLGTTSIYVTHDQAEAMTLGHRIAVLRDGELQQVAPPLEVYEHPANRFVAGFIGTPPMNFIGDIGIRPHDVVIDADGPVEAEVELVEPLGREVHIHCRAGGDSLLVVADEPPAGSTLRLRFPEDRIHRFP